MTTEFNHGRYKIRQMKGKSKIELLSKQKNGKFIVVMCAVVPVQLSKRKLYRMGKSMAALFEEFDEQEETA